MMIKVLCLASFLCATFAAQQRNLTPEELSTATCTKLNGQVSMDTTNVNVWKFHDIPEQATPGASWVCDITSDNEFTAVSASYTLRSVDPFTGANQDPDDNEAMTSWGSDPSGHNGYFSFGTPTTIIHAGGTMGSNVAMGGTRNVNWSKGNVASTNTVRFGFAQSANHEDFSIEGVAVTIYGDNVNGPAPTPAPVSPPYVPSTSPVDGQLKFATHSSIEALTDGTLRFKLNNADKCIEGNLCADSGELKNLLNWAKSQGYDSNTQY